MGTQAVVLHTADGSNTRAHVSHTMQAGVACGSGHDVTLLCSPLHCTTAPLHGDAAAVHVHAQGAGAAVSSLGADTTSSMSATSVHHTCAHASDAAPKRELLAITEDAVNQAYVCE